MTVYDPDKMPRSPKDTSCPACKKGLLGVKAEVVPHPSGQGLAWQCPHCGASLRENDHQMIFLDVA